MKVLHAIPFLLLAASVAGGSIEILWETPCPVDLTWRPIRIEGSKILASGGLRVLLTRPFPQETITWSVDIDPDGILISCDEIAPGQQHVFSTAPLGSSCEVSLIARNLQGDTVWTCALENTNSYFYNGPTLTELSDGGCVVDSRPDCNTMYTEIQRITSAGETVWHYSLGTDFLLEPDGPVGEAYPAVYTLEETSAGDILAGGSVSQLMNTPDAWFVCLLDGDTGNPLWKATGFALGEASLLDVLETADGRIIAVGESAVSSVPEGMAYSVWGPKQPLVVILDADGELLELKPAELDQVHSLQAMIEYDSGMDFMYDSVQPPVELIVAGVDTTSSQLVLVRVDLSAE